MSSNTVNALAEAGQSIWLDYIRRSMTRSGELATRVETEGLRGVTSNPSIFRASMGGGDEYGEALTALSRDGDLETKTVYETLAIEDIREACDAMRPVYDATEHIDGYVSFEVSPRLSRDTEGTIAEAQRLWTAVDRPNLMVKVPGTAEGVVAIEQLIREGINVNVTLIFARDAYDDIAQAFIRGLQARLEAGKPIADVASVASFFVSRIDSEVDNRLDAVGTNEALALRGTIAIANAKLAYRSFESLCRSDAWRALASAGARPQRLLWASTGTKNAAYSDVLYIEELVGAQTVNTVPPKTLAAFLDHGKVATTLTENVDQAQARLDALERVGVSLTDVTDLLLENGLSAFEDAMDDLLATVALAQRGVRGPRLNRAQATLSPAMATAVSAAAEAWTKGEKTDRLWNKDASVWTGGPEARWLGWLDIIEAQIADCGHLDAFAADVRSGGFTDIVLLGMGGSSLCPDVLAKTFSGRNGDAPTLRIVDSTVGAQVARIAEGLDLSRTLFIVASKSGSTLEPTVLMEFFMGRAVAALGDAAAKHFVAITDPGSKLEAFAAEQGFRTTLYGVPEIGGRFSAFSNFGMIPAAGMGIDTGAFLDEAKLMLEACRQADVATNPGVNLGLILGAAADQGRNKLTLLTSPAISGIGAWLEQLVAESTGKHGQAIIPIDGETARTRGNGEDRIFVYLRTAATADPAQDRIAQTWREAGESVVILELDDIDALPQELFRWQIATAVAGAVMGVDPFDQPDVEASKIESRKLTTAYEEHGTLPELAVRWQGEGVRLHTDDSNVAVLGGDTLTDWLRGHLSRLGAGDYFTLLAYVDMNAAHKAELSAMRNAVRRVKSVATCLGFGPRFLHSTGQAYKGGPNTGVFIQITADPGPALAIPGRTLDFGVVAAAQAAGDFQVLIDRERRAIRVHLGADVLAGLQALRRAFEAALAA
ncbi:MAG: bifunctional transaldolase/phosoglucose isomerase [Nannocystaceae bacterium]|nr:bifunctional transaldolase/phosoglucose isomerase [Nannocystaceae bacterium]